MNIKKFADGQYTADASETTQLNVVVRGNTYEELFKVAAMKQAFDSIPREKKTSTFTTLSLYSLIGMRSDRQFGYGQSLDLRVIAAFINMMDFDKVRVFHPHSSVVMALLNNSEVISHEEYVRQTVEMIKQNHPNQSVVLVSPDAGAFKETFKMSGNLNVPMVASNKVRAADGEPILKIQDQVKDKICLVVDDIADGGRTFSYLAKELKSQGASNVYLYVSHAQFNYGFEQVMNNVDHIFCTNSFKEFDEDFITQFEIVSFP